MTIRSAMEKPLSNVRNCLPKLDQRPINLNFLNRPADDDHFIRIGMPHLGFNGLSENWLLRECGHRHWNAICEVGGVVSDKVCDSHGNRLYASFVAIALSGDSLDKFYENDYLKFELSLERLSKYRFFTKQSVYSLDKRATINMQMLTIFIKKPIYDNNHLLCKEDPCQLSDSCATSESRAARNLIGEYKTIRGELDNLETKLPKRCFCYTICPLTDFNGARLLYFANYQKIMDRAEWSLLSHRDHKFTATKERKIYYFGNANFAEPLDVFILNQRKNKNAIQFNTLIRRQNDNRTIAFGRTVKEI